MALRLAFIEVSLLVLGISGTVLLWNRPLILDWIDAAAYLGQASILALSCVTAFYYNDLFDIRKVRRLGEFAARLIQAIGVSFILLALCYAIFPDLRLGSGPFFSSLLILGGLVIPVRAGFYALMRSRAISERVLILGTSPLAWKIAAEMEASPHLGYTVLGFVDDGGSIPLTPAVSARPPILGSLERLTPLVEELRPDRIVVALAERRGRLPVRDLLEMRVRGTVVVDGITSYEYLTGKLAIENLVPSYLIFSRDFERPVWRTATRRLVSIMGAAIGLVLSLPFMGIIAILILLDSGRPALFIQKRVGLRGRVFSLLKFRTMRVKESAQAESVWERNDDSRVTRVGAWLRMLRLDELPQFFNILKGDMDFIGPRPEIAVNVKSMTEKIPFYALRHVVRPGITGWAQIKYGYSVNQEDVTEKTRYDLYYIKHLSLSLDLRILIDTVKIVLFGHGAAAPHASRPSGDSALRLTPNALRVTEPAFGASPHALRECGGARKRVG